MDEKKESLEQRCLKASGKELGAGNITITNKETDVWGISSRERAVGGLDRLIAEMSETEALTIHIN
uniref:Uncharacterized protein n=1 Tax=Setaria digitata TaxID=48799 RepID=A0A915PVS9_9BILA